MRRLRARTARGRFRKNFTLEELGFPVAKGPKRCVCGHVWRPVVVDGVCPRCKSQEGEILEARRAYLVLDGWHGLTSQAVDVIRETPKRLEILALKRTKLAGRSRWIQEGETALVPKHALRDEPVGEIT